MTSSERRVLHCAETIKGGIASYLRELIPLQGLEFGADNIILVIPRSQANELPLPRGVHVEFFEDKGNRAFAALRAALKTIAVARYFKPSVIHIHSTFAGVSVRPLLTLLRCSARVVYCSHGWAWDRPMSNLSRVTTQAIERWLAKISDCVVCISEHEFNSARNAGVPLDKLALVRNAINAEAPVVETVDLALWPINVRRVLFVGRLDQQKGLDVLLEALSFIEGKAHAVVAGASVLSGGDGSVASANATYIGWVSPGQLEALFLQADVLVVPSRWEGFGLVAAEGMRAGLAVIATSAGGLPEVVEDGVTGLIVSPNSPRALAEALLSLDVTTLRRMGDAGRERVRRLFSMDRLHRELRAVYRFDIGES